MTGAGLVSNWNKRERKRRFIDNASWCALVSGFVLAACSSGSRPYEEPPQKGAGGSSTGGVMEVEPGLGGLSAGGSVGQSLGGSTASAGQTSSSGAGQASGGTAGTTTLLATSGMDAGGAD